MGFMVICDTCGNEVDAALTSCPHCDSKRTPQFTAEKKDRLKVVNLEKGMPLVHEALHRLDSELQSARKNGIELLVMIHGYGSSGEGGAIKKAVRRRLLSHLTDKKLSLVVHGEDCGKKSNRAKNLLRRFPAAKEFLQRANPGITLVIPVE